MHKFLNQPPLKTLNFTCTDFHHNADGTWSPTHPVTINNMPINPKEYFSNKLKFGGVRLGAVLDKECGPPAKSSP